MLVEDKITTLSEDEMIRTLAWAWNSYYGVAPEVEQLACCLAQMALETGRMKFCHNWNVGNIKKVHATSKTVDDGHNYCMYRCSEILNGKEKWFDPPHAQTHFRAYDTARDGMVGYIKFLVERTRYVSAWGQVLAGNPEQFSKALSKAGYYTANEGAYTRGVVRLFNEFRHKAHAVLFDESGKSSDIYDEGPNTWSDVVDLAERNRILALSSMAAMKSVAGEFYSDDLVEDELRASITPNLDIDEMA